MADPFNRTVTITGMDEVLRNLSAYGDRAKQAAAMALKSEGEALKKDSQDNYVPVDQGTLKDKAYVTDIPATSERLAIEVGYHGPYAAYIHENPRAGKTMGVSPSGRRYRHWATTGGWKYLELPLMAAESGMLDRLAARMRSILGVGNAGR